MGKTNKKVTKYKLVAQRRIEKGDVYYSGDIVNLSHYSKNEIKELLQQGQYIEVK